MKKLLLLLPLVLLYGCTTTGFYAKTDFQFMSGVVLSTTCNSKYVTVEVAQSTKLVNGKKKEDFNLVKECK